VQATGKSEDAEVLDVERYALLVTIQIRRACRNRRKSAVAAAFRRCYLKTQRRGVMGYSRDYGIDVRPPRALAEE